MAQSSLMVIRGSARPGLAQAVAWALRTCAGAAVRGPPTPKSRPPNSAAIVVPPTSNRAEDACAFQYAVANEVASVMPDAASWSGSCGEVAVVDAVGTGLARLAGGGAIDDAVEVGVAVVGVEEQRLRAQEQRRERETRHEAGKEGVREDPAPLAADPLAIGRWRSSR